MWEQLHKQWLLLFCFYLLGILHLSFHPKVMFTFFCKKTGKMILFSNPICYSVHFDGKLGEFRPLIFRVVIKRHASLPVFLKILLVFGAFLTFLCLVSAITELKISLYNRLSLLSSGWSIPSIIVWRAGLVAINSFSLFLSWMFFFCL